MSTILPFVVSGVVVGAIYGLAAAGLVLTYKTSGIFNFAHGSVAAISAYLFYQLHTVDHLAWGATAAICVLLVGPLVGLLLEFVGRHLALQRTNMKVVGSVGIILVVQGLATIKYGPDTVSVDQYLPGAGKITHIAGTAITYAQITTTVIALLAVVLLYLLFRYSRLGIEMRAVVNDATLVSLHRKSPIRIRRMAWIIGSTFAALSGVLLAPILGVNATVLTLLVVQAFGAAAVGAFSNIPVTFAASIVIGIASSISRKYVINIDWLSGLPQSLPFVVLIITLVVLPRHRLAPQTFFERPAPQVWHAPPSRRVAAGIVVLALLLLLPFLDPGKTSLFALGLTQAILLLALAFIVKTAGQISLATPAFAALSAVAFSQFISNFHLPWALALLLGALVSVPIGALVSLPALRLSGLFVALATLGMGLAAQYLIYPRGFAFTTLSSGRAMPRPSGFAGDRSFYFLVLMILVVVALCLMAVEGSRLGRLLHGVADSRVAVSVLGLKTSTTLVIAFCLYSFFAGIAGILYGATIQFASSDDAYYTTFNGLVILALLAILPFRTPWFAAMGVTPSIIAAYVDSSNTNNWLNVAFGISAIHIAMQGGAFVMPERLRTLLGGRAALKQERSTDVVTAPVPRPQPDSPATTLGAGLEVRDLTVRFGGLVAVDSVSLNAPTGRITGLIGPNGAGKTTTFNACSGITKPTAGRIILHGEDVTRLGAASRGIRGLGRTFQVTQLCDSLTVGENIGLARECRYAGSNPAAQIVTTRDQRRATSSAVDEAMELCGVARLERTRVGSLSTGQRRLVELARCLAGDFDMLLLDEPSSGLDNDETRRFAEVLRHVLAVRGCGMLLVEHDMELVMGICEYIYVMDFGKLIFEGSPFEVLESQSVRAAYLGMDAVV